MSGRTLGFLLFFAAGAGILTWAALGSSAPPDRALGAGPTGPKASLEDRRLDAILARLDAIERRLDELSLVAPVRELAPDRPPIDAERLAELDRRLDAIERRLASSASGTVESRSGDPGADVEGVVRDPQALALAEEAREQQRQAAIEKAQRVFTDPQSTEAEKLEAHGALRRIPDAYTENMIAQLVDIGLNSRDAATRARVWRYFDGESRSPSLVTPLVGALRQDPEPRARAEAAETLALYAQDPAVLQALRFASENDAADEVRRKARQSLVDAVRD